MIDMTKWISLLVSMAGSGAVVLALSLLISPYLCRIAAAALLAWADAVDQRRQVRVEQWRFYHNFLVERRVEENEREQRY